jgi:3-phenylpropionate/trans-cinnamate dioxygenase ferredoxin reductase component
MAADGVVIVGGGQAGSQLAASLRENGYGERIRIIAAEASLPYQRPPLSKAFLKGRLEKDSLLLRSQSYYSTNAIDILLGEKAVHIDRERRSVALASGAALTYDHLVLATGSCNRRLDVEGAGLDGIFYLRSIADAEAIKSRLGSARQVAIIGAGFVGLELACVLRELGASVLVIEASDRPLWRAISAEMSLHLANVHREAGIRLLLGSSITGFHGINGQVAAVDVVGLPRIEVDMVLVGIGARAQMRLARSSGLATSSGIEVDDHLATSDPLISAIGDCAIVTNTTTGRKVRLESVQNAVDQARCLGATLSGRRKPYQGVPWFWSDQGGCRLQIAGLTEGYDRHVVRGDIESGRFSIFCYSGGRLLGVESLNHAADHMAARRLLAGGVSLHPSQAADMSFNLKAHALTVDSGGAGGE